MEPQPIESIEIRPGDRVRAERPGSGGFESRAWTFTVTGVEWRPPHAGGGCWFTHNGGARFEVLADITWTLLDRPTPTPAVGSRWRHSHPDRPEFVYGDDGRYYCYKGGGAFEVGEWFLDRSDGIRDYLTPIPEHGDGCSPWQWDRETDTTWVQSYLHDIEVSHAQVGGRTIHGGQLVLGTLADDEIRARLVPWSERGQAND